MLTEEQKAINKKEASKRYYKKNQAKIRENQRKYSQTIPKNKKNDYARRYYQLNKNKIKNRSRAQIKTPEQRAKYAEYSRLYRLRNLDKIKTKRKQTYEKNKIIKPKKQKIKKIKINKKEIAEKDKNIIEYYIKNIWNR